MIVRARARRGALLIDLLITVALIGVLAAVAVPALRPNEPLQMVGAAVVLAADIEYAQSATLAAPDDPTLLRVNAKDRSYMLAKASDPHTPIKRPGSKLPYVVNLALQHGPLSQIGIEIEGDATQLEFDAFGRLVAPADRTVMITSPSSELRIRVARSTGSVFIER